MNRLTVSIIGALIFAVAVIASWRWVALRARAEIALDANSRVAAASAAKLASSRPDYVLEVVGLGVTYEKYRQGRLWDAVSKGSSYQSLREIDPQKYPWSYQDKRGQTGNRANDAMENGARALPLYWGTPAFSAGWGRRQEVDRSGATLGDPGSSGMGATLFVGADGEAGERIDRVLTRVFDFFDQYPDVPYVVVSASDSPYDRDRGVNDKSKRLQRDGRYVTELPDSSVLFVLARRERVDQIRPFVFDDVDDLAGIDKLNAHGFGRRVYLNYIHFTQTEKNWRNPTVAEWLDRMKAFTQREDIYPKHFSLSYALGLGKHPPKDFKPTPWFPVPWNQDQLEAFDRLPTLGYLHRPVFVKTVDEHGQPLSRRDARAAALAAGWQAALQTLPEAERKTAPARVAVATGSNVEQTIALTTVLNGWAAQGGPELDHQKPTQWIDTDARLGNTGAATWFMQMAIGVMGSYKEGGVSAAINLRDPSEASIILITPPSEEKRKTQHNAEGGEVWRSVVGSSADLGDYAKP